MSQKPIKKYIIPVSVILLGIVLVLFLWPRKEIQWQEENGYRWSELQIPWFGKTGFQLLSPNDTGIQFSNSLTEKQIKNNRVLLNGSGVALGDIDNDGLTDIYFCKLDGPNVLYKNLGGWKFQDITQDAGVACDGQFSSGAVFADIDGDQDLDLLVTSIGGPNSSFMNDGSGKFVKSKNSGLISGTGASSMALSDIDGDGDLDLYVANYKKVRAENIYTPEELRFANTVERINGLTQVKEKFRKHYVLEQIAGYDVRFETGEPDQLYINDGTGQFAPVSMSGDTFIDEAGDPVPKLLEWGLTVRFQDIDGDLDPDIYLCNDFESPDRVWINDGKGHFQLIPKLAIRSTSNSSMTVDFSDINRDGFLDYFVTDMLSRKHELRITQRMTSLPTPLPIGAISNRPQYMRNTLFLNRGDNTYAEIAQFSGVDASEWTWSAVFLDIDLDGYEDILVSTGTSFDVQDMDTDMKIRGLARSGFREFQQFLFMYPSLKQPNMAFRNNSDLTFEETSHAWGLQTNDISNGFALGDLDNDGDLDAIMNRYGDPAAVYRNETKAPRVAVRLRGEAPNTQGIGAKIKLTGGPVIQTKEVISGGIYLSGSDPIYSFATGDKDKNLTIEVVWRSGTQSKIANVKPNRVYEIFESDAQKEEPVKESSSFTKDPYFEDVSHFISHNHHEDPYDDFNRQPLLSKKLSQFGPGIAWFDTDKDGDDDLIISGGKGGQIAYYRNDNADGFKQHTASLPNSNLLDQTAVVGFVDRQNRTNILVGVSNYESLEKDSSSVQQLTFENGNLISTYQLKTDGNNLGPLSLADYNLDGKLDLFIGGRSIPGKYPQAASSKLYLNRNDIFEFDFDNSNQLDKVGMVSSSVFSDLDEDGDPDLLLAIEWGPIKIFLNDNGKLLDATEQLGLSKYLGWWNGINTGDFNNDGRMDIVATNWGMNNKYKFDQDHPLVVYYNDLDGSGTTDIIEAYFDADKKKIVPYRKMPNLAKAMPFVSLQASSNRKYAASSISQIIGPRIKKAEILTANTLAHMIFLNQKDYFEAVELPQEAQFSPAFYCGVADYDGDGMEDIFLSQNFFANELEIPRSDAGRGLWLKGDGTGQFAAIPGHETGIKIYGEQRGAAIADYDKDGRIDIAVSQNAAETKLYHNIKGKPGLRIQLIDSNGNASGVGATIRIKYSDFYGPAREIHAGSGYWSQDSRVQVMGLQEEATGIWVRWPGGEITETSLSKNVREVKINQKGEIIGL